MRDVCERKHKGSTESVIANRRTEPTKSEMQRAVWLIVRAQGTATSKDVAAILNKPLNAISPRISELKEAGLLAETGTRRDGCAVLRWYDSPAHQPALF